MLQRNISKEYQKAFTNRARRLNNRTTANRLTDVYNLLCMLQEEHNENRLLLFVRNILSDDAMWTIKLFNQSIVRERKSSIFHPFRYQSHFI